MVYSTRTNEQIKLQWIGLAVCRVYYDDETFSLSIERCPFRTPPSESLIDLWRMIAEQARVQSRSVNPFWIPYSGDTRPRSLHKKLVPRRSLIALTHVTKTARFDNFDWSAVFESFWFNLHTRALRSVRCKFLVQDS